MFSTSLSIYRVSKKKNIFSIVSDTLIAPFLREPGMGMHSEEDNFLNPAKYSLKIVLNLIAND